MRKNTFKVLFYLRGNHVNKDGTSAIMIRISIDGEIEQLTSKLYVDPKVWDTKRGRANGRSARVQWGGYSSTTSTTTFYIIDGCETIASGAFQRFTSLTVYIPSSVRSIAPDAIISRSTYSGQTVTNGYGGIQDGVIEVGGSGAVNAPAADPNATEVARYNIQGVRLSEPTDGVNIVQMSDGTAQKVLVK